MTAPLIDPAAPPAPLEATDIERAAADEARARHWRRNQRLTAGLLVVWAGAGFGVAWFARALDFPFFGWPFAWWVAAQGGVIVFVVLVALYARRMARLDRRLSAALRRAPVVAGAPDAERP